MTVRSQPRCDINFNPIESVQKNISPVAALIWAVPRPPATGACESEWQRLEMNADFLQLLFPTLITRSQTIYIGPCKHTGMINTRS